MKSRRLAQLLVIASTAGVAVTTLAPAAHAVPPPNGVKENLALVGSNATETLMGALAPQYNTYSKNTDPDTAQNILSHDTDPPVTIPDCPSGPPGGAYPNGSSAGIQALNQVAPFNQGDACYDIARSTRNRSSSDLPTDEFYAYGADAIVPLYWKGGNSPSAVSLGAIGYTDAELTAIYTDCTIVTWHDLGVRFGIPSLTSTDKIIRFRALSGTGARTSADGFFGGGDSAAHGCATGKPDPIDINENDATQVTLAQQPDAVYYDSLGSYMDPARKPLRNHGKAAKVQNEVDNSTYIKASATTVLNGQFPYRRYIFNVIRTTQTSYNAALDFVGFDDTGGGYLCKATNTSVATTITAHGFVPLPNTLQTLPDGTTVKTTCRKNPPALVEGSTNSL